MRKQIIKLDSFDNQQKALRVLREVGIGEFEIEIRKAKNTRTLPQNDLYWMWCQLAAKYFTEKSKKQKFTKDDMHDIWRNKFLGYGPVRYIGSTMFEPELKTTTKLKTDEMWDYMMEIEVWSAEHGLLLPTPEDSQYDKEKKKKGAGRYASKGEGA